MYTNQPKTSAAGSKNFEMLGKFHFSGTKIAQAMCGCVSNHIYPEGPQRALNKWSFRKNHYLSSGLQSTILGDYSFNGLRLAGCI